ncbi:hypothetical protein SUGI_0013500 [Cryptomeria japonica]|uniref:phytol kinase 1, chloroplastic n=1 Tax=Cryptomeria japonica TaxID=3369 RepID=UPI002408A589|nr:phytol kinase 1, chloroplastic [Cryptomeria japonica]GLJ05200.1 hypothetical protein SUGI_0013500 [Cryptomeria japonica]
MFLLNSLSTPFTAETGKGKGKEPAATGFSMIFARQLLCQKPISAKSGVRNVLASSETVDAMVFATVLPKPYASFSTIEFGKARYPFLSPAKQMILTLKCKRVFGTTALYGNGISRNIACGVQVSSTAWDMGCTTLIMLGAYGLVSGFDVLTKSNILDQKLSRKLVHISSGLLFMLAWPLFSSSADARYIAAIVPFANCARLLIYGLSYATNEGLVKAVSREGKPEELLRGPMYYVLVLIFCTTVFWRESPIGVVALAMMCGGDGIADIMGRRFGGFKLPYNREKSWAGTISMLVFGFLTSLGVLSYFSAFEFIHLNWETIVQYVAVISVAATIVESLPVTQFLDDNISVPLTCVIVGLWLFKI